MFDKFGEDKEKENGLTTREGKWSESQAVLGLVLKRLLRTGDNVVQPKDWIDLLSHSLLQRRQSLRTWRSHNKLHAVCCGSSD